jgi:hypothetical protein
MKSITIILTMLIFLLPTLLTAETIFEKNLNSLLAEKRALVKEHIKLTEKESSVFWPLYDDYEKTQAYNYKRLTELIGRYLQERENLSDKSAKEILDEMLDLKTELVKSRRTYAKKFSEKLPHKKVLEYFLFEERIAAGRKAFIAEELPPIK